MYKNQLQELAQRSCFNLPSYTCIREGPDHAPRFKAVVNFNGESFESPVFCTTLKQAEHAAAEVALSALSKQGPSRSLAARVLDETGVYKNLLQETAHRAGLNLPVYTTVRSGPGHTPVFTCTVELAGLSFTGDPAKTKKQAQKNAALIAWSAIKQLPKLGSSSSIFEPDGNEQQEQAIIARALAKLCPVDGSKLSPQNDRHRGRAKRISVGELNRLSSAPLAILHQQNWIPSNVFPDETYQLWHQEHSPSHQSHLPTLLPPSPTPANDSRNVPRMQSTQGQFFSITDHDQLDSLSWFPKCAASSLFFSNCSFCVPPRSSSQVSMEVQENSTIRKEWFATGVSDVDGEPSGPSITSQLNPITYSQREGSNHTLSVDRPAEPNKQGWIRSSITDISEQEGNAGNPTFFPCASDCHPPVIHDTCSGVNIHEVQQYGLMRSGSCSSRPSSPNHLPFMLKNSGMSAHNVRCASTTCSLGLPRGTQSLHPIVRCSTRSGDPICQAAPRVDSFAVRNSFLAPPVKIRAAIPLCSARPGSPDLNARPSCSIVPAVHVRSVAPVFSAPPRRAPNSIPERDDISTTTGIFGKIHI